MNDSDPSGMPATLKIVRAADGEAAPSFVFFNLSEAKFTFN